MVDDFQPSACQTCWLQICHTSGLLIQLLHTHTHIHSRMTFPIPFEIILEYSTSVVHCILITTCGVYSLYPNLCIVYRMVTCMRFLGI